MLNQILTTIFTSVFHRILDFKNGVEFLFRPLFICRSTRVSETYSNKKSRICGILYFREVSYCWAVFGDLSLIFLLYLLQARIVHQ